ncbi:Flp family type IVb pilin [Bradyrhizobium sp. ORS 111]|uniref:Flp family type IVb pilin n=1 Tax=Bradyrhizobium sp. ORS 111 TaxID=1685958 RepID=UPI003890B145
MAMKSSPLLRLWRDKRGATFIECGLVAAAIAVPLVLALNGLGAGRNVAYSSLPSSNVSTDQLDELNLAREPH